MPEPVDVRPSVPMLVYVGGFTVVWEIIALSGAVKALHRGILQAPVPLIFIVIEPLFA